MLGAACADRSPGYNKQAAPTVSSAAPSHLSVAQQHFARRACLLARPRPRGVPEIFVPSTPTMARGS
ncbi:hypothetical protein NL676_023846 [Syzygium grande]|nr:hypothetical protein NL676_023846 [Syzygium grande]